MSSFSDYTTNFQSANYMSECTKRISASEGRIRHLSFLTLCLSSLDAKKIILFCMNRLSHVPLDDEDAARRRGQKTSWKRGR